MGGAAGIEVNDAAEDAPTAAVGQNAGLDGTSSDSGSMNSLNMAYVSFFRA